MTTIFSERAEETVSLPRPTPADRRRELGSSERSMLAERLLAEFGAFLGTHTVMSVLAQHARNGGTSEEVEELSRRDLSEIFADS
ncbi:hypothetical protein ACSMXN_12665 [Jatrophihabitans sp. DSM 45814]